MNNPIIIGVVCAIAIVIVIVWLQAKRYKLNQQRKTEGKKPVGPPPPVDVIDWTKK